MRFYGYTVVRGGFTVVWFYGYTVVGVVLRLFGFTVVWF